MSTVISILPGGTSKSPLFLARCVRLLSNSSRRIQKAEWPQM